MSIVITCCRKEGDETALRDTIPDGTAVIGAVGAKSMGEGYNKARAENDVPEEEVIVFTHTDVRMWSSVRLWEDMIAACLEPSVGFVGVAGSKVLRKSAIWWDTGGSDQHEQLCGAVAHSSDGKTYCTTFGPYGEVAVLDGVFLAIQSKKLESLGKWKEDLGWHFYDIDMTLRATIHGYTNKVIPLPIFHGSVGLIKKEWHESRDIFLGNLKVDLPVSLGA